MREIWKDVPGYEGSYQISNLGRVKSLDRMVQKRDGKKQHCRETILRGGFTRDGGYRQVLLHRLGKKKCVTIHRLVLEAFVGPCPEGMEARHFPDGSKTNNRLDNLSWGTYQQNERDKIIHGTTNRGSQHGNAKLEEVDVVEIREFHELGISWTRLAKLYQVSWENIRAIVKRRSWKHV